MRSGIAVFCRNRRVVRRKVGCRVKIILALAKERAVWVAAVALASSLGLPLSSEVSDAVMIVGLTVAGVMGARRVGRRRHRP